MRFCDFVLLNRFCSSSSGISQQVMTKTQLIASTQICYWQKEMFVLLQFRFVFRCFYFNEYAFRFSSWFVQLPATVKLGSSLLYGCKDFFWEKLKTCTFSQPLTLNNFLLGAGHTPRFESSCKLQTSYIPPFF